jgi:3-methyladenine DNA glycosylase AlkC
MDSGRSLLQSAAMAEPLKNHFGPAVPQKIAASIAAVHPVFDTEGFLAVVLAGYEPLDLMARGRAIARALRRFLPVEYREAVAILLASCASQPVPKAGDGGMASFFYLPHTQFVAEFGLDDFDTSLAAQYVLTQRFTAEFSIRPFLDRYLEKTLERLAEWARDPEPRVRRLVSEGTRPRLPWAPRVRALLADPRPALALLELLKDDPDPVVRRSVANHLNDIGKDHPELLAEVARRWSLGASAERRALLRHALRSAVKRGEAAALEITGFGGSAEVEVRRPRVSPERVPRGGRVEFSCEIVSQGAGPQRVLVDFQVHYVKANGQAKPKVFKWTMLELAPGQSASLRKALSLEERTTRKHYPGRHTVELLLNGRVEPLGAFELG